MLSLGLLVLFGGWCSFLWLGDLLSWLGWGSFLLLNVRIDGILSLGLLLGLFGLLFLLLFALAILLVAVLLLVGGPVAQANEAADTGHNDEDDDPETGALH